MIDLAVCEWNPGSNRATVDPVVAVARLDMPAATRAVLVEKMKRHQFDDVVSINWAAITSDTGANSYDGAISNMNFSTGHICRKVTRNGWTLDHTEGAIVYLVDGRAFGFASACGNLFELVRNIRRANGPAREATEGDSVVADRGTELPATGAAEVTDPSEPESSDGRSFAPGWAYTPAFVVVGYQAIAVPVPCVPEPEAWVLILSGLAAVGFVARRRAA
jgi:hypothetical protein